MEPIAAIFIAHGLIFGGFCGFVAGEKNRDQFGWGVLGFFFGIVALISLVAVPSLQVKPESATEGSGSDQLTGSDEGNVAAEPKSVGYITDDGKRWVCSCGASNGYKPDKPIQNCINCRTNRDHALAV